MIESTINSGVIMKRRMFIKSGLQAAGALSLVSFPYHLFAGEVKKYAQDIVTLGNTGIKTSRLAMGTGTNGWKGSSSQTRQLGIKGLADMLHFAYDNGVIFWDSADQYGSHPHLKEALKTLPREKIVIMTKTRAATEKEMRDDLDRFRQEIGTDYLDIVLLHCMEEAEWPLNKRACMDVLSEAREDGIVKAHGVSCHTLPALEAAAASDWVQVDLARFNPAGVSMDADPRTVAGVLRTMKEKGKGIIGMKVFGVGKLTDRLDECLQYHLAHDFIDSFTIGQESPEQFTDLLTRIPEASVRG
jgi:aryl-alcohol dehydrogenase-like predicted oxidoreductase